MSMTIDVDMAGLDGMIDEMQGDVESAAGPAAQAAIQILYDEILRNVAGIGKKSGNLERAIYQAYSKDNSATGRATYHVSWNARKAPHGHLLENGFIQRYATYVGTDGQWYTAVRPEMRGKPAPSRRAPQAVKDAYYVPRPGGPVQWLGKAFVRRAVSKFPQALDAAQAELLKRIHNK